MDKAKARIGLWLIGGFSGILLLLYLPVIIWSPPWDSSKGCYDDINDRAIRLIRFEKGELLGVWGPSHINVIGGFHAVSKNHWLFHYADDRENIHLEIKTNESQVQLQISGADEVKSITGIKTFNPFTVWYIKYLEWTH